MHTRRGFSHRSTTVVVVSFIVWLVGITSACTSDLSHTAALLVLIGVVSYCLVGRNRISMYVHAHCFVVEYFIETHDSSINH